MAAVRHGLTPCSSPSGWGDGQPAGEQLPWLPAKLNMGLIHLLVQQDRLVQPSRTRGGLQRDESTRGRSVTGDGIPDASSFPQRGAIRSAADPNTCVRVCGGLGAPRAKRGNGKRKKEKKK